MEKYIKISNISRTEFQNLNVSHLVLQLSLLQFIEARSEFENEDIVDTASAGDAPTTSEWSTILLPTKVQRILDVWR